MTTTESRAPAAATAATRATRRPLSVLRGLTVSMLAIAGLLGLATAAAGATVDVVNERIPLGEGELERHWGVDCDATSGELRNALQTLGQQCKANPQARLSLGAWRQPLQLCAAAHNAPGSASGSCRNFAAAYATLQQRDELGCDQDSRNKSNSILRNLECL